MIANIRAKYLRRVFCSSKLIDYHNGPRLNKKKRIFWKFAFTGLPLLHSWASSEVSKHSVKMLLHNANSLFYVDTTIMRMQ